MAASVLRFLPLVETEKFAQKSGRRCWALSAPLSRQGIIRN
jgi:hypothetical protein